MKKNKLIKIIIASFLISVFCISCDIGLGEALDLVGPDVQITKPTFKDNSVAEKFDIGGTAYDAYGVTYFTLEIENGSTFKYENNIWQYRKTENDEWEDLPTGVTCDWTGTKDCTWSISNVSIPGGGGEYTLTAKTTDAVGNTSKNSIATRKVVYDKDAPVASIISPEIPAKSGSDIETRVTAAFTTGENAYQDFSLLRYFVNGTFTLSGTIDEKSTLAWLKVSLKDGDTVIWESRKLITHPKFGSGGTAEEPTIDESKDVLVAGLRSWTFENLDISKTGNSLDSNGNIVGETKNAVTAKKMLTIYVECSDASGNENASSNKNQGQFCYWPESDTPWTTVSLSKSSSSPSECYPESTIQGYSFDDDGIKSIDVKVYKGVSTNNADLISDLSGEKANGTNTYQSWSIKAPKASGKYTVTIAVTDIYNKSASMITGYFEVTDVDFPKIDITSPVQTAPLFGNASGKVTFNFEAADNNKIDCFKVVYLKDDEEAVKYLISSYSGWGKVTSTTTYTTDNGNRLWYINPTLDSTTATSAKKRYTGTLELNLFGTSNNDLGIDGSTKKLNGQHFVIYATDGSNSSVQDFAVTGDTTPPNIAITKIKVKHSGETNYTDYEPDTYHDKNNVALPYFKTGDVVKFKGTWSDNSTNNWSDKSKISDITFTWNSDTITVTKNDGNWETGDIAYKSSTVMALFASITDYAGNTSTTKKNINVQTDPPELLSITSENASGSYGRNEEILITLKFNKPIVVSGSPTLTLSNNKTASFDTTTSGTQNLTFKYKTPNEESSNDNATNLNVKSINKGSATFKDTQTPPMDAKLTIPSGQNLANNKTINIITNAPKVTSTNPVKLTYTSNEYGDKLTINFDSEISKGTGDIVIEQDESGLKVPAVLSESQYKKLTAIQSYYTKGTNGTIQGGTAPDYTYTDDLATKYILNFDKDSNDGTVVNAYKGASYHRVIIDVNSSDVKIGDDKKSLEIDLTGTPLPCLGASYNVYIPENLVYNAVDTGNTATTNTKKINNITFAKIGTQSLGGIEEPIIRIEKKSWSFKDNNYTKDAEQPLTVKYKFDCQTPGATVSGKYLRSTTAAKTVANNQTTTVATVTPVEDTGGEKYCDLSKPLGDSSYKKGETYKITATATKSGVTKNAVAYAYRTTIVCESIDTKLNKIDNTNCRVWLRGGDDMTGKNTTAGFPMTWDTTVLDGAVLLTKDGNDWYFVSWDIKTNCYCAPLEGLVDKDSLTQGPSKYCYAQNGFITQKDKYWIEKGGYLVLKCNGSQAFEVGDAGKVRTRGE